VRVQAVELYASSSLRARSLAFFSCSSSSCGVIRRTKCDPSSCPA